MFEKIICKNNPILATHYGVKELKVLVIKRILKIHNFKNNNKGDK